MDGVSKNERVCNVSGMFNPSSIALKLGYDQ